MNRNRLDRIERVLKPDIKDYSLMATIYPYEPEKSRYSLYTGIESGGLKSISKGEYQALKKQVPADRITEIYEDIERV